MTSIHIVLITYALDVQPLVDSLSGNNTCFHIYTHSRLPASKAMVERYWKTTPDDICLHDHGTNRGLARSWNDGILEALDMDAQAILVVNDDVEMSREDMLKLAQGCFDYPEAGIIEAEGWNQRMNEHQILGYAVFGINRIALDTVGYFDPNYLVIYGEDVDYSRRCALSGVTFHNIGNTGIDHVGSATVGSVPALREQHQVTFPRNENYHRLKHGGGYGHEVYLHPFSDPTLSWKITAENRENPYPDHRRTDQEIVKI